MRKWMLFLILALLLNVASARAEGDIYYTSNEDRYYHADENCDRPASPNWWGAEMEFYERDAYRKYPVSVAAAREFEKQACPVCVDIFQPVYLGEHMPDWPYEAPPWEISGMNEQDRSAFRSNRTRAYMDEAAATEACFDAYFEEFRNNETGKIERRHEFPECYAGRYSNLSLSNTFRVVRPDDEILKSFERLFGGGAWIVSAKYGYDEIMEERERIVGELRAWCAAHPDVDAQWVSAGGPDYENHAVIGISGADWQQAAAAMEETAPVYIHFVHEDGVSAVDF